jgi:hypothetical protein
MSLLIWVSLKHNCMIVKFHYNTLAAALDEIKAKGFNLDFNLEENSFFKEAGLFKIEDFRIVDIFRYEGSTDRADEISLYALESIDERKGFFLASYGAFTDEYATKVLSLLRA